VTVKVDSLDYGTDGVRILSDVSLHVRPGEIVGLLGPNGSGKSTTLKCMLGLLEPTGGTVRLFDRPREEYSRRELARRVGYIGQENRINFDFSVGEIVSLGRAPYKGWMDPEDHEDRTIVREALRDVDMQDFEDRTFRTLSGGEKQRVLVARCLAQQADVLVLDEPTNHLDVRHRLAMLDLLAGLNRTVLMALHDLNLAGQYCDRLYVLRDGAVVEHGSPGSVLTESVVEDVFGRSVRVGKHPITGDPHLYFVSEADRSTPSERGTTGR